MKLIPNCDCHNLPKLWVNDSRLINGGYWTCHVRTKERKKKYNNSLKGIDRNLQAKSKRVRVYAGGLEFHYKIDDLEKRENFLRNAAEFKARQQEDYRKESQVWLDQLDSPENIRNG